MFLFSLYRPVDVEEVKKSWEMPKLLPIVVNILFFSSVNFDFKREPTAEKFSSLTT